MLGVAPTAGIDEIRARYRQLARERHPDHQGPTPTPGPDMAALNAAWTVLGNPARRAAYDASLAGPPHATSGSTRPHPRDTAIDHTVLGPTAPGCLSGGLGGLPWIAVLVVLAVIFVFTAYAAPGGDDNDDPGEVSTDEPATDRVRDLRGSCIQVVGGATLVVDCLTVPNEGRIVAMASTGASCPDATVEWVVRQQGVLACTEPGTAVRPAP